MTNNLVELNDSNFEQEVVKSALPVVVDFWAAWCGPCRLMAPIIERLAPEYDGKIKFTKLDVDANMGTAQIYTVMSIPTFIVFKNGQPAARFMGAMLEEKFKEQLEKAVK